MEIQDLSKNIKGYTTYEPRGPAPVSWAPSPSSHTALLNNLGSYCCDRAVRNSAERSEILTALSQQYEPR